MPGLISKYDKSVRQCRLKYVKYASYTVDVDAGLHLKLTAPPGTNIALQQKARARRISPPSLWRAAPPPWRNR
mgnify:CR=1 FL=1